MSQGIRAALVPLFLFAASAAAAQSIALEKATNGQDADIPPGPLLLLGSPVTWTYVVTNTGSLPLSNLFVFDDQSVVVTCPGTTLAPGDSLTCTGNGIAQAGQYANLGVVIAELPDGTQVSATDPSHYFVQPAMILQKLTNGFDADSPPGPALAVGSAVAWTYVVTNTGTDPLSNISVTDDQGVAVSCPATTLAVGDSMTCTGAGSAQQGQYENFGQVTAQLPGGSVVTAFDISHYFGQVVFLEKATNLEDADLPPGPLLDPGDPVTWTYAVTNPGPDTVSGLAVTDDQGVVVSCPATSLAAGEAMTCMASGIAQAGQYANVGTVTALLPAGGTVSASDPSHYFGRLLRLEKATNGQDADLPPGPVLPLGAAVAWTYVVTNTGTETLTAVAVTDDQGVTVTCPATTLAGGESMTCTANGVTLAGQYANLGTVTATHPTLGGLTDSDPSHYLGEDQATSLSATKSAALAVDANGNGVANPGDTLLYTVTLVNDGPVPATGVLFNDTPDPNTALVVGSVTTTAGTVTGGNGAGDTAVGVDVGTVADNGGTVTITFRVTIDAPLSPGVSQVVNQGVFSGGNFADVPTDDPGRPGAGEATAFAVGQPQALEIPTLTEWGLLALGLLLAGLGVRKVVAEQERTRRLP